MQSKSALRGRLINDVIELWCLVASGGLEVCISSTSFQKNDIDCSLNSPKNTSSQHVFFGISMNNLLSYCRLTDARMRASEKYLPVHI